MTNPNFDSEIDFDDEREENEFSLDVVEAMELGVLFDDPDELSEQPEFE